MPYLIKKISGEILDNFEGNTSLVSQINAMLGVEDYIDINNFIGFTQNFTKVVEIIKLPVLTEFGLKNKTNFLELEISYNI